MANQEEEPIEGVSAEDLSRVEAELPDPHVKVENRGSVPLQLDHGMLKNLLKEWGRSTDQIDRFKIVFRPGYLNPKFNDRLIGGFYQPGNETEGDYIEVYTSLPDADGNQVALSEQDIQKTLLHELEHARQFHWDKSQSASSDPEPGNPAEGDADSWAEENFDRYGSMVSCSGGQDKDLSTEKSADGQTIVTEQDNPARTWEEEMNQLFEGLKSGQSTSDEFITDYRDLYSRGQNMAEMGNLGRYEFRLKIKEIKGKLEQPKDEMKQAA